MTFVLATRNRHKAAEIQAVLGAAHCYLTLADFPGAPEVIEDSPTFAGNAVKKAQSLALWLEANGPAGRRWSGAQPIWVLADDSGLEVDALGGAPGVHSARFAALDNPQSAGNTPDADNNAKLLGCLEGVPAGKRTGRFRCVLALARIWPAGLEAGVTPRPAPEIFEGRCDGHVGFRATGTGGFGYDPLFTPEGSTGTFGELGEAKKNQISHRGRALRALKGWLDQWHTVPENNAVNLRSS